VVLVVAVAEEALPKRPDMAIAGFRRGCLNDAVNEIDT